MGPFSKRSKRIEGEGRSSADEFESDMMGSDSDQFDDDDDNDASGSDSQDNTDEENKMEENEEEEGSDDERAERLKDAEMEELEKEIHDLRKQQDLLNNLKRHKDEDAIKGQAVKNQKALWDKTLELRFLLQKAFANSNRLPQEPTKSTFCSSDKLVDQAYSDLESSCKDTLNSMLELQEALVEQNPSIIQGNSKDSCKDEDLNGEADEDWLRIHKMHCKIVPYRNNSVDKWHRKTQVTTGAAAFKGKLKAFNQNISEQVAGHMRDPSRMIKRMQLRRFSAGVFGEIPEESKKEEDVNGSGDPELLDDSEFYQQLLKEFFESCDLASSETAFYALKRLQPKKRKAVDRRASKSRKIRYNVHEKIVNFMAPVPVNIPPMAPKLFENLFGMGNQTASLVPQSTSV